MTNILYSTIIYTVSNLIGQSIQTCTKFCDSCNISSVHIPDYFTRARILANPITLNSQSFYCTPYSWSDCSSGTYIETRPPYLVAQYYVNYNKSGGFNIIYQDMPNFRKYLTDMTRFFTIGKNIRLFKSLNMSYHGSTSALLEQRTEFIQDVISNIYCLIQQTCTNITVTMLQQLGLCIPTNSIYNITRNDTDNTIYNDTINNNTMTTYQPNNLSTIIESIQQSKDINNNSYFDVVHSHNNTQNESISWLFISISFSLFIIVNVLCLIIGCMYQKIKHKRFSNKAYAIILPNTYGETAF